MNEHNLKYQIVDFDSSTIIESVDNYGALIVLGRSDSAKDLTPKMQNELTLINKAIRLRIPYLGICLGLQSLVSAMGGNVIPTGYRRLLPESNYKNRRYCIWHSVSF